jgi:hypothetical protein
MKMRKWPGLPPESDEHWKLLADVAIETVLFDLLEEAKAAGTSFEISPRTKNSRADKPPVTNSTRGLTWDAMGRLWALDAGAEPDAALTAIAPGEHVAVRGRIELHGPARTCRSWRRKASRASPFGLITRRRLAMQTSVTPTGTKRSSADLISAPAGS